MARPKKKEKAPPNAAKMSSARKANKTSGTSPKTASIAKGPPTAAKVFTARKVNKTSGTSPKTASASSSPKTASKKSSPVNAKLHPTLASLKMGSPMSAKNEADATLPIYKNGTIVERDFEEDDGTVTAYTGFVINHDILPTGVSYNVRYTDGEYTVMEHDEVHLYLKKNLAVHEESVFMEPNEVAASQKTKTGETQKPRKKKAKKKPGQPYNGGKVYVARVRKWKNCKLLDKMLYMTGSITGTGSPDGALSTLCKTRLQIRSKEVTDMSVLFNYLVLIFSLDHVDRPSFVDKIKNLDLDLDTTSFPQEEVIAIKKALPELCKMLKEFGIGYDEEQHKYTKTLEEGDVEFPNAIFEVKILEKTNQQLSYKALPITSPENIRGKTTFYIKLTRDGFAALQKKEDVIMDTYGYEGFSKALKDEIQSGGVVQGEDHAFLRAPAKTNSAMLHKALLYNSPNGHVSAIIAFLHDNPGKWDTASIKKTFMPLLCPQFQRTNISFISHLLCDDCKQVAIGSERQSLRLSSNLYPEGVPDGWGDNNGSIPEERVSPLQIEFGDEPPAPAEHGEGKGESLDNV